MFGAKQSQSRLIRMLDDHKALNEVLAGPNDAITEQQRSALIRLAQHFGLLSKGDNESGDGSDKEDDGSDKEDDGSDKEDNDSDEEMNDSDKDNDDSGDSPKPRKPTKTSRHPWAPFMRLKKVVLAYSIEHHLRQYGPDAEKFLSDDDLLKHKIFECAEDAVSDKFMAYYEYTLQLAARRSKDGIRWCFSMLMYFDLVKVVKPKSSGKKVGRLMLKDIIKFLGESSTLDPKMAYKNMNKWAGFGRKLDLLCTTFGPGCIFYLVDFFSTNFLQFVFTASGTYHDQAFAHLEQLGLKEAAVESGADRLGADIRDLLIQPVRMAVRRSGKQRVR